MIRILVDSSSDMTLEQVRELDMDMVPLQVRIDGKEYADAYELPRDRFYELLEKSSEFPTTSQPSPAAFEKIFAKAKEKGDEVICILLSTALSGTCQSAKLARAMVDYDGIYIVDSRSATGGIQMMAEYAMRRRAEGIPAGQIALELENFKSRVRIFGVLDTLEYLAKGGRLNKGAARFGNTLHLKPLVSVPPEGTVDLTDKQLGKTRAMEALLRLIRKHQADPSYPVFTLFSLGDKSCQRLEEKLQKEGMVSSRRVQLGSVLGSHIGPGAFGVVFVEAKETADGKQK